MLRGEGAGEGLGMSARPDPFLVALCQGMAPELEAPKAIRATGNHRVASNDEAEPGAPRLVSGSYAKSWVERDQARAAAAAAQTALALNRPAPVTNHGTPGYANPDWPAASVIACEDFAAMDRNYRGKAGGVA